MVLLETWSLYTDHARAINLVLLSLVIAALTTNMIVRRNYLNRRTRRIQAWLYLLLMDFVYSYAISIQNHRPFNLSVGFGSVFLIGTLVSVIWHPEGDSKTPPHDGALTSRFMYWLDLKVRRWKTRHRKEH